MLFKRFKIVAAVYSGQPLAAAVVTTQGDLSTGVTLGNKNHFEENALAIA